MNKNSGSDKSLVTVTLPQLNHDLYRVMRSKKNKLINKQLKPFGVWENRV